MHYILTNTSPHILKGSGVSEDDHSQRIPQNIVRCPKHPFHYQKGCFCHYKTKKKNNEKHQ